MNRIIGIIAIVIGIYLFAQGVSRHDSLVGHADTAAKNVANSVDGGARTPKHVIWMVGGGVLIIVGAALTFRRSPAA